MVREMGKLTFRRRSVRAFGWLGRFMRQFILGPPELAHELAQSPPHDGAGRGRIAPIPPPEGGGKELASRKCANSPPPRRAAKGAPIAPPELAQIGAIGAGLELGQLVPEPFEAVFERARKALL